MMVDINLMPLKNRELSLKKIIAISLIVFLIIVVAALYFLHHQKEVALQHSEASLNSAKQALIAQNANPTAKNATTILQLQSTVTSLQSKKSKVNPLLTYIFARLPEGGTLSNFSYDGNIVSMNCHFNKLDEVAGFLHSLKQDQLLTHPQIGSVTGSNGTGYTTQLTVTVNQAAYQKLGGGN